MQDFVLQFDFDQNFYLDLANWLKFSWSAIPFQTEDAEKKKKGILDLSTIQSLTSFGVGQSS